ncbi:taurine catabolism dioxygenase [Talaromyces pinophilus]|uniref:Taurine catabolism dioxygenase n=1 Tax=Talaromyces pinophilus TaxID=128442 RepID=A0A0B8MYJ5_TALPI|nr:hypothetical protein DPV78_000216 [Talaromyces pinophilus]GAM43164.1 taurine catabolism dioxygenase [Talaromyces pinophilus]
MIEKTSIPSQPTNSEPMKAAGLLDGLNQKITVPAIGTEFLDVDLVEMMEATNSDELLRDLAITIAERGVVMFRKQTRLDGEKHKQLIDRLGKLSGRPKDNGLLKHVLHPLYNDDPEMITLIPERVASRYGFNEVNYKRQNHAKEWHTDMAFEKDPPAFSSLRLADVPPAGGDTMWVSLYDAYDRLSTPFQKLFEGLTATWAMPGYRPYQNDERSYKGPRGSPRNADFEFEARHPCVRTNPVTGWKALWVGGGHCAFINNVTSEENTDLLNIVDRLITKNHDIQVRYRWEHANDIAIWDNRSVLHIPTRDQQGKRLGYRVITIGETPYLDPKSVSKLEALEAAAGIENDPKLEALKSVNLMGMHGTKEYRWSA